MNVKGMISLAYLRGDIQIDRQRNRRITRNALIERIERIKQKKVKK